jgi:hypothetical protein
MTGALSKLVGQVDLEGNRSYSFIYSGFSRPSINDRKLLILLVGAGRFERPTPCAQGSFRGYSEMACFQLLLFQGDAANVLRHVETGGFRQLHFYLQSSTMELP